MRKPGKVLSGLLVVAAFAFPPFSPLTKSCKSISSFATDCAQIGLSMEHGDTFIAQGIGLSIERSIFAPESSEAKRVAEARRQLDWLVQGQSLVPASTSDPTRWLQLLDESHSEAQAMRTWLIENGFTAEPPPGWSRENKN